MLARFFSISLVTTLGCGRLFGIAPPVLDDTTDGSVGDTGSLVDARLCFGSGAYALCLVAAPTNPIVLTDSIIDTSSGTLCLNQQVWSQSSQPDACFVVGTTITLSDLVVVGSRPIVFVAAETLNLTGTLEVASHTAAQIIGPGSPSSSCAAFPTAPQSGINGAAGGAGASFMSSGRNGGDGNGGGTLGGVAAAAENAPPTVLRAGCRGQNGGSGGGLAGGGRGGEGGGAAVLVAGTTIGLSGTINASGAGAGVAPAKAGGGGGGSGGMIVLYAPTIVSTDGRLVANGGSGSSGASTANGTAGNDPAASTPSVPAAGPAGSAGAGDGGAGYALGSAASVGTDGLTDTGGGGGGGGGGFIRANIAITGVAASPAIRIIP